MFGFFKRRKKTAPNSNADRVERTVGAGGRKTAGPGSTMSRASHSETRPSHIMDTTMMLLAMRDGANSAKPSTMKPGFEGTQSAAETRAPQEAPSSSDYGSGSSYDSGSSSSSSYDSGSSSFDSGGGF